jgi:hypothetical protein
MIQLFPAANGLLPAEEGSFLFLKADFLLGSSARVSPQAR